MSEPTTKRFSRVGNDRLAELGKLAGGLVHELKNPLGVILLNAEMALSQSSDAGTSPAERERLNKRLRRIQDSARSLQAIVQSFLVFARPTRPDPEAVDLNALLEDLIDGQTDLLETDSVTTTFHPDPGLPALAGDLGQLRSVFLNIITNAREALTERDQPRKLVILTRAADGLARVVIANNGPPLPERIASHLFEPFMSGKDSGTGLGLAIVRRLVELHHGTITASSDPSQGVSFTLEFPTTLGPARARTELPMPEVGARIGDDATPTSSPFLASDPVTKQRAASRRSTKRRTPNE